jgi:hypothetical protein
LLLVEVDAAARAGYRCMGIGLRCDLETCHRRNRGRRRVLPDAAVEATWDRFEWNVTHGVYEAILGAGAWLVVPDPDRFDLAGWVTGRSSG